MPEPWPIGLAWALAGPVLLLGAAPLLDGVGRRVRARLHARVGPPLLQGYVDLAKLAGKDEVVSAPNALVVHMPHVALAAAVLAGLLLPLGGHAPLGFAGDALVFLYLLGLSTAALVLAGTGTGSPYSFLGASRELLLLLLVEPAVAAALFVVALKAGTFRLAEMSAWQAAHGPAVSTVLAAVGIVLALLAWLTRLPFDLGEAEQELTGGVMVEFSGRALAVCRWTLFVRWLVVTWLVAEVFVPLPLPEPLRPLGTVVVAALLFGATSAVEAVMARLKLGQARLFLVQVGVVMLFAVAFALIGA